MTAAARTFLVPSRGQRTEEGQYPYREVGDLHVGVVECTAWAQLSRVMLGGGEAEQVLPRVRTSSTCTVGDLAERPSGGKGPWLEPLLEPWPSRHMSGLAPTAGRWPFFKGVEACFSRLMRRPGRT